MVPALVGVDLDSAGSYHSLASREIPKSLEVPIARILIARLVPGPTATAV